MKPTRPAVPSQISDADRKRKIRITDKCTMTRTLKKWRGKGESTRVTVDRYRDRCIEGRCLSYIK
jgi:hypothetical protein